MGIDEESFVSGCCFITSLMSSPALIAAIWNAGVTKLSISRNGQKYPAGWFLDVKKVIPTACSVAHCIRKIWPWVTFICFFNWKIHERTQICRRQGRYDLHGKCSAEKQRNLSFGDMLDRVHFTCRWLCSKGDKHNDIPVRILWLTGSVWFFNALRNASVAYWCRQHWAIEWLIFKGRSNAQPLHY